MKRFLSLLLICVLPAVSFAQAGNLKKKDKVKMETAQEQLLAYSHTMHTDSVEANRFAACKQLISGIVEALKTQNSFNYDFAGLKGVVVKNAPDNSFRTITWELNVNRDEYRHYGAIQWNEKKLRLVPLMDRSNDWRENPENVVSSPKNWLGYVIYNILPGGTYNGQPYYFVFGYDRHSGFIRRKVIDVITYDAYDNVQIGLPIFATFTKQDILLPERARIILDYGAEANLVLKNDPVTGQIIYENLIMMPGGGESGPLQMPDGSYHALELREDGLWYEAERVFSHKYEEAPIEARPAVGKKDIFGKPIGGGR